MSKKSFKLDALPTDKSYGGDDALKRVSELQERLRLIQQAYLSSKRRAVIVFEGIDAAGKGGTIRRLTSYLDPRSCKVWPIGAPSDAEQGRHYLYRFWQRLPEPGTLAIFDRSWYGRVLVERVEGFAAEAEWRRAYGEINAFEKMLTDDGARLVKIFLHITPDEQLKRFEARIRDPLKRWKLTYEDFRNRRNWDGTVVAVEEMIDRTSTKNAPWLAIPANDKRYARITALEAIVDALSVGVDLTPPPLSREVEDAARELLGLQLSYELKITKDDG
ncbi:MAG: polyphosphate kinase 2 family protein [Inquilinaceae bacterium]